jgi:hypothetical protein
MVTLEPRVRSVSKDKEVILEPRVLRDHLVDQVKPDLKDRRVIEGSRVPQDNLEQEDHREMLAQ